MYSLLPTRLAFAVWTRNFTVYRTYMRASLTTNIGEPLLMLFAMGYGMGAFVERVGELSYLEYIAPGLIVVSNMFAASFECTYGSFSRMTVQRTYESILATPVSLADLVAGEILWGMTKGLISTALVILVMVLFGVYAPGPGIVGLFVTAAAVGLVFAGAAVAFSAIAPTYEFFNYFFTLGVTPMFFLSGVFFPLDRFPVIVQWFSTVMPLTHAVALARWFFHDTPDDWLWLRGVILLAMITAGYVASLILVRRRVVR